MTTVAAPSTASRQRVLDVLNGQTPDRIPIDLGSSPVTGMHVSTVANLRDAIGLEKKLVKVHEPYQMLGYIEDDMAEAIGVDTALAMPIGSIFGFPPRDWKQYTAPWGQDMLVPGEFYLTEAEDGGVKIYPDGDRTAEPSAHMHKGGFFFDSIIRQEPLDEDNLNVEDNLQEFSPLTEEELDRYEEGVKDAYATGRAVYAWMPGTALGDIALVPAPQLAKPKGIRDVSEWYMATVMHQDYVGEVFDRQLDIALENLQRIQERCGNKIDVAFICGTDFGTQESTFCSDDTYRALWLPRYQRLTSWIHENTSWKIFKHSCGAITPLLDSMVESGFDIINPVQCSAAGMEPQLLKDKWGKDLVFWGGCVDTQKTLPFGTPEEVRKEVLERCEIFSKNGGLIFNPIHNVQALTPVENLLALYNAVHEFNGTGVKLG